MCMWLEVGVVVVEYIKLGINVLFSSFDLGLNTGIYSAWDEFSAFADSFLFFILLNLKMSKELKRGLKKKTPPPPNLD